MHVRLRSFSLLRVGSFMIIHEGVGKEAEAGWERDAEGDAEGDAEVSTIFYLLFFGLCL